MTCIHIGLFHIISIIIIYSAKHHESGIHWNFKSLASLIVGFYHRSISDVSYHIVVSYTLVLHDCIHTYPKCLHWVQNCITSSVFCNRAVTSLIVFLVLLNWIFSHHLLVVRAPLQNSIDTQGVWDVWVQGMKNQCLLLADDRGQLYGWSQAYYCRNSTPICFLTFRSNLAVRAWDTNGNEVTLYWGIIDILTCYDWRKKVEYGSKAAFYRAVSSLIALKC